MYLQICGANSKGYNDNELCADTQKSLFDKVILHIKNVLYNANRALIFFRFKGKIRQGKWSRIYYFVYWCRWRLRLLPMWSLISSLLCTLRWLQWCTWTKMLSFIRQMLALILHNQFLENKFKIIILLIVI